MKVFSLSRDLHLWGRAEVQSLSITRKDRICLEILGPEQRVQKEFVRTHLMHNYIGCLIIDLDISLIVSCPEKLMDEIVGMCNILSGRMPV